MKWPDERPCKDNTAHEKGTGYPASSACAAQVHLRERELRSFPSSCEAVVSSLVGDSAGAYRGFLSMKQPEVLLLPPGWDASPLQGHPPAFCQAFLKIYSLVESGTVRVKCLHWPAKFRTQTPQSGVQRTDHWATCSHTKHSTNFLCFQLEAR